ncbi:MAG: F0F1 ATP synthase subunit B [Jatrophihabitans sp.]
MSSHVTASSNFLVPNATFIVEFIAFLLILGIIWKYVLPYIQGPLRERQTIIEQQMKDAETAKEKLAQTQAEYQKSIGEARTQAAQIRDGARAEGQAIIEEMRSTAQTESARIIARGEEQLSSQRSAIVRELRAEIGTLAVDLSERIVGQRLADDEAVQATVDSFLDDLEGDEVGRARAGQAQGQSR